VSKNVAVFVDVANVFYAAKAAGVDIDYVTLLKSASAGRDLVRAYAYTGLDPDNENQRNFHDFLRRSGYKVVSKDIRKYGDGKVKANLDIELVVDMMKTARNLDIAIVVSGDGDFAPAIRAVQEQGVRVEVISFRGNTSSDLIEVADIFTDITQLAKVEKGSSRSGRRVASDDEDLSMTEVPDKQTEGSGEGRGRGRGRGRMRDGEAAAPSRARGRSRSVEAEPVAALTATGMPLVALPGERLARAGVVASDAEGAAPDAAAVPAPDGAGSEEGGDELARRRRRRGGRGRGRGRGEGLAADAPRRAPLGDAQDSEDGTDDADRPEEVAGAAPRGPRPAAFGSVWDSQIGVPQPGLSSGREVTSTPFDDGDFDEPEIPEYLIAERRSGGQANRAGGRGGRGGARAGYASAVDRERYGRGASGGVGGGGGGGINRYPDVRSRDGGRDRDRDRGPRPAPRSSSGDPWSEVPPELEAMLRAQVTKRPRAGSAPAAVVPADVPSEFESAHRGQSSEAEAEAAAPRARAARRSTAAARDADATPKTRTRAARKLVATDDGPATDAPESPKRRTTRKAATAADGAEATPAPQRRATRKTATAAAAEGSDEGPAPAAPKRRATRKAAAADTD